MTRFFIIAFFIALTLGACRRGVGGDGQVKDFLGSTLDIPSDMGGDFTEVVGQKDYSLVFYLDSGECVPCSLQKVSMLNYYRDDFERFDIGTVLVIKEAAHKEAVSEMLSGMGLDYPVLFDDSGELAACNPAMTDPSCSTFLLDSQFKVVWIGNPAQTEKSYARFVKMMDLLSKSD